MRDRFPAIGDYGAIGDCRTAALISREGAIEWLCLPRFDSPSMFAAILDRERGGHFTIRPAGPFSVSRRYVDGTNVLETTFATPSGEVRLTDAMTVATEAEKGADLWPNHEIVRQVEVVGGEVEIEVIVDPRTDYGRRQPHFRHDTRLGFVCARGAEAIAVRSEIPLHLDRGPGMRGTARLRAGERRYVSLAYEQRLPLVVPALGDRAAHAIDTSIRWWRKWVEGCTYEGAHRDMVVRSALALKLLTFAPSGAVVAAATTSLPEEIGGVRNWDYRYCWLRDAALTLRALFDLGFMTEAEAFLSWMLHATRLTWPHLQILYDVYGEAHLPETELEHLGGYMGSRPVRVGNAASEQLQLDTYGEVIDAASAFVDRGGHLNRATARMLAGLGRTVMKHWRDPDEGIWEIRAGRRHHTLSKAMCWVALDRLIGLEARGEIAGPAADWRRERDAIREEIERRGFNEEIDSYVNAFGGDRVDAGLLLMGLHGYADPSSPRMRGTYRRVQEELGTNGLLYRYLVDDGLPGREGAFGIASFWGIECRARAGDVEGAAAAFHHMTGFANDLGLFSEEIDPASGAALGNFPQAFTHIGLINAALTIEECARGPVPHKRVAPDEEKM